MEPSAGELLTGLNEELQILEKYQDVATSLGIALSLNAKGGDFKLITRVCLTDELSEERFFIVPGNRLRHRPLRHEREIKHARKNTDLLLVYPWLSVLSVGTPTFRFLTSVCPFLCLRVCCVNVDRPQDIGRQRNWLCLH